MKARLIVSKNIVRRAGLIFKRRGNAVLKTLNPTSGQGSPATAGESEEDWRVKFSSLGKILRF